MVKVISQASLICLSTSSIMLSLVTPSWAENSACFFEHADFDGLQLCVKAEAEVPAIRLDFNDIISSIEVGDGWLIEACQHSDFQGWCKKYSQSVSNVGPTANDQISSFRVVRQDEAEMPQACFFEHADFQGRKFCLESGENWDAKTDLSLNDIISSMTVENGLSVTVYQHSDFGGTRLKVRQDVPAVTPEWNDKISSIKVR
jgi:hypothetical protein